jgi:hypothetical protein
VTVAFSPAVRFPDVRILESSEIDPANDHMTLSVSGFAAEDVIFVALRRPTSSTLAQKHKYEQR